MQYIKTVLITVYPRKGATIRLPGGGLGFSVWPEYFFLSLSGPKYFFSIYHEPEYFFLKPYWARIFFSIQYKFGSNFLIEPQIGYKTIILRLSAVCLCVCLDRNDFKWHNIANSKYIAIQLYMRVYTLMLVAIEM